MKFQEFYEIDELATQLHLKKRDGFFMDLQSNPKTIWSKQKVYATKFHKHLEREEEIPTPKFELQQASNQNPSFPKTETHQALIFNMRFSSPNGEKYEV